MCSQIASHVFAAGLIGESGHGRRQLGSLVATIRSGTMACCATCLPRAVLGSSLWSLLMHIQPGPRGVMPEFAASKFPAYVSGRSCMMPVANRPACKRLNCFDSNDVR
jgi:hypothetical protein